MIPRHCRGPPGLAMTCLSLILYAPAVNWKNKPNLPAFGRKSEILSSKSEMLQNKANFIPAYGNRGAWGHWRVRILWPVSVTRMSSSMRTPSLPGM